MSLINDALRRAKDAQQQTPLPAAPNNLPFRPVEPAQQHVRRGLGLLLPFALGVVALLVLLFAWTWTQARGVPTPTRVAARTTPAPPASPRTAQPAPVQEQPSSHSLATAAPSAPADIPQVQENATTNATALTPPKPAPLRLQAIVFNPKRPSAMINGKTLFVGDKVGDMRVVAIAKDSATLAGTGLTNVLSLPE